MTQIDRPGPQYSELIRKLRARPLSSWQFGDRIEKVRRGLSSLAAAAAQARGNPSIEVPDIGVHGLADQCAVLIKDASEAGVPTETLDQLVASIAGALGLTTSGAVLS